jgi:hypothetical protein
MPEIERVGAAIPTTDEDVQALANRLIVLAGSKRKALALIKDAAAKGRKGRPRGSAPHEVVDDALLTVASLRRAQGKFKSEHDALQFHVGRAVDDGRIPATARQSTIDRLRAKARALRREPIEETEAEIAEVWDRFLAALSQSSLRGRIVADEIRAIFRAGPNCWKKS